jgi:hypothetical protein
MRSLLRLSAVALVAAVPLTPAPGADVPADWAYKKYTRPRVPEVRSPKSEIRNEIDRFLLAKLGEKGLTFAPEADRRTLIRRVYFDLIGLPPAPEEVEAFVADQSRDAYEKLVDKLLASPQFGERMAIGWLDLVRFAESDGFKADDPRPNAWRYRDYVIKSFNADKPFDRFIKEQIAGDELYPGDFDALVATGFLRHFPYEYNAVDVEQKRQDMLNDITDTTAATFLGVTLGCCRCHDHKTDPIPQRDYYRLQAFFAGFWPVDAPLASSQELQAFVQKEHDWEEKTAELRRQMAEIEKPVRDKATAKERQRFPDQYAGLLDIPTAERTPLQKQLGLLVEKQVYTRNKVTAAQMPAGERAKWEGMARQMAELEKDRPPEPPRAMTMSDVGPVCPPTRVLKRGNWRKPDVEELAPGFLSTIDDRDVELKPTATTTGRRSALAEWVASKDNPLTARVIVNRLWQHHFGKGIVATPSDFGVTGDRPTHPELLDWLAAELTANGWSLKHIHRLIVTSAAYRQAGSAERGARNSEFQTTIFGFSVPSSALRAPHSIDPENTLLWQFPRHRLDGEALRDAILTVSGQLNPMAGGPSVFPEIPAELKSNQWKVSPDPAERNRRSVYVFVKRNLRYPIFALFDAPDRNETCSRRFVTTTAPQALTLLNDSLVLGFAKNFAARVTKEAGSDPVKVVDRAFVLALSRQPTAEERDTMLRFLKEHKGTSAEAVTDLCHALLNLNEFLYVD